MSPTIDKSPNWDFVRHPDYVRMAQRWQQSWDFWRGGIYVLSPDREISTTRFVNRTVTTDDATSEDPNISTTKQAADCVVAKNLSYLHPHQQENIPSFEERCKRQVHLPLFQYLINVLSAGILKSSPNDDDSIAAFKDYLANVDGSGNSMDAFRRQKLAMSLCFGRVHVLTDRKSGEPSISRYDEIQRGIRTYSLLVSPLDLVDWALDEQGKFIWAVIREREPDTREPGQILDDSRAQYRILRRDHWELWRRIKTTSNQTQYNSTYSTTNAMLPSDAGTFELVEYGDNPFGEVMLSTTYCTKDGRLGQMACESPISDGLDWDRHILNQLSELDEVDRMQAFSILCLPEMDGGPIGPVDVGPDKYLRVSPGGMPQYVSPDSTQSAGKWSRIQEKSFVIRQLLGASRGKAEFSKEERSAQALMIENEDKRNQLAWWSGQMEEGDLEQFKHWALWEKQKVPLRPVYCKDFVSRNITAEVQDLVQLSSIKSINPEVINAVAKPVIAKKLRDAEIEQKEIDAILILLDEVEEPPEPPASKIVTGVGTPPGAGGNKLADMGMQDGA